MILKHKSPRWDLVTPDPQFIQMNSSLEWNKI